MESPELAEPLTTASPLAPSTPITVPQGKLAALLELKSLAWPLSIAVIAGLFHYVGRAAVDGKISALGIYALTDSTSSQDFVFTGARVIAQLALLVVVLFLLGTALVVFARTLARSLPNTLLGRVRAFRRSPIFLWCRLLLALVAITLIRQLGDNIREGADSLILKPYKDVGEDWLRISMDQ